MDIVKSDIRLLQDKIDHLHKQIKYAKTEDMKMIFEDELEMVLAELDELDDDTFGISEIVHSKKDHTFCGMIYQFYQEDMSDWVKLDGSFSGLGIVSVEIHTLELHKAEYPVPEIILTDAQIKRNERRAKKKKLRAINKLQKKMSTITKKLDLGNMTITTSGNRNFKSGTYPILAPSEEGSTRKECKEELKYWTPEEDEKLFIVSWNKGASHFIISVKQEEK